jgi:hypothetical protein
MDESDSKTIMEWILLDSHNFHVQLHPKKRVSKVKLEGITLQCKRVKQ